MVYTNTIAEFLAEQQPFKDLSEETRTGLLNKLQALRFAMGKVIMMREQMPGEIAIIYQGEARLLGYDPRTNMPVTLEKVGPGGIIGWINLARGLACETAIASSETVVCLVLKQVEFINLLQEYPQLAAAFRDQCSLLEMCELLGEQLKQLARGEGNLKELALKALPATNVTYLNPGRLEENQESILNSPSWFWFVSGGGEIVNYPVGSVLQNPTERLEIKGNTPARLIGIPESTWQEIDRETDIIPNWDDEDDEPEDPENLENGHGISNNGQKIEVLEKKEPLVDENKVKKEKEPKPGQKYPYIQGKNPVDEGVAIFQMLSQYFKMPFRKEQIRRIISEQLQQHEILSFDICGAIAELMGLNVQLATVTDKAFTRLNAPLLIRWQDYLAIVYEISDRELVIGVPELGIVRRTPETFLETWGPEGQILLLKTNKNTPQQRFGLSWFLPSLQKYKRVLIEVFIASFFVQLFALANPLMIQVIIDKVIVQNSPDTLQVLGFFLLVIAVFEAVLTTLRTYLFVDTTNRVDMTLGSEIINHLLRLPLSYFQKRPVGEISTRVGELEKIRQFLTGTALTVVLDAVFSVVYIVVMAIYSLILTVVALGIIPLFVALTLFFSPIIRRQLRTKAERNAQTQSYLVEVMSGIETVKAQNIELRSRWQWQERYAKYVGAGFQTVITSTMASSASNFLNKLSGLLVLWVGAYLVLQGELSLGQLIAFRIIASYVTSPILRLTQLWQNFQETALSLERLADIVDTPQEAELDRENIPMPLIYGGVKYENISFRFKPHGPLQLCNVSVEFEPGTFVGIVGQSGAGKSTLTKLLSRLYEAESGRILVDGYDINKVELYSLRRQVGVVPQSPILFQGTVQENIALTSPDATTEEIIHAAQVAAAHDFIMNLPNGYNTMVGERGEGLSGGQRQRVAIARTVLQRPRMLVLDEATSALDYATEQEVCHNLIEEFSDRTVFFITHRLGTIKNSDVIIMMEAGTIAEQGTHNELMAMEGLYYHLYRQQESGI